MQRDLDKMRRRPFFFPLVLPVLLFIAVVLAAAWLFDARATTVVFVVRHAEVETPTDADPDAVVSATFAEDLDVATVTGASFRVTRAGQPVAGLLSYAERRITFTPERELETGVEYVVTLGSDLRTASEVRNEIAFPGDTD